MRHLLSTSLMALALGSSPALAESPPAPITKAAPLTQLVDAVNIPYQRFTLPNGLTVLVNTDRKAPVVSVSVWYGVGSKNEPKGKTGFAHLFEHLMFNGSENAPGDFFEPLQQIGATDVNGTTWFDRTNYFETVPTGALDLTLMLESDRMGHLLGAVTQQKLDNQRAVVQNEKRQGDNRPYGMVEYEQLENLYPTGHPYHHSTIGSMVDLDSASLDDVKGWFRDHYGPNNSILVLSGDIDLPTAKAKVAKWFGEIPAGPKVQPVSAPVPTLPAPLSKTIKDQVSTTRIYRMWAIPGLDSPDHLPLEMAASVLGGLASSRLDDAMVRQSQDAVSVSASAETFAQAGQLVVFADVKPGKDPTAVAKALDAQIAKFVTEGPTTDELQRAATSFAVGEIRTLEQTGGFGGKAPTLAEGLLYSGDPTEYRKTLQRAAKLTPAEVRAAAKKWMSRPVFALTVEPGKRAEGGEARGGFAVPPTPGSGAAGPAWYNNPALASQAGAAVAPATKPDRSKLPEVGQLTALDFPAIERATLTNGMKIYFARRTAVPTVTVRISFDAGSGADPKDALGTQSLLLQLMDQGTTTLNSTELARARERLGVAIHGMADVDTTSFQMDAVTPNLAPSLALLSDYILRPALDPKELERMRAQQLTAIANEFNSPGALAGRVLMPALYGTGHPYGNPPSGSGDPKVVKALTRDQLVKFHARWFRPDTAKIFVVGDTTLAAVTRLLEANFGRWKAPRMVPPVKDYSAPIPALSQRIILVDRPGAPQSMIYAGRVLGLRGSDDQLPLQSANDVLGGNFLGRINTDLRETKGWSYGAYSMISQPLDRETFRVQAPVQSDKTGESIVEIRKQIGEFLTTKGVTPEELKWTTNGSIRELPGSFETSDAVLGGIASIVKLGRPDNFYGTLASRYGAMTVTQLDQAARAQLGDGSLVYVVVGDAAKVRPQLEPLGLPIEVANPVDTGAATGE
ncbi:MAG: insulinase family protein [Sphingomonadales bacterium]|nr:insulinase family protein [Sphingomonadales bacterium]